MLKPYKKSIKKYLSLVILFILYGVFFKTTSFSSQIKAKTDKSQKYFTKKIENKTTYVNDYISKQKNTKDKEYKLLDATQGGNTTPPWSNAFNFQKSWGTQTDPRTGAFSSYITVGSLRSNLGHGPNIALKIDYNSNTVSDPDSLGQGWRWNLTHFNTANNQLFTSEGKVFNLEQGSDGHWWPRYHKLNDIQIEKSKNTHFIITYADGLREILNHDGYEVRLEQQDGRGINFSYQPNSHLLSAVSDDRGNKITLKRTNNDLTITSYNAEGKPIGIRINSANNEIRSVVFPVQDKPDGLKINASYHRNNLLSQLLYPTGLTKKIEYECSGAMQSALHDNSGLCVVVKESVSPGSEQPSSVINYTWDKSNANKHNYLARNAGLNATQNTSRDILFEAPGNYTYQTTEDNGIISQVRTYNKYHLLIKVQRFSHRTGDLLSEMQNFFCRTDQNDGCANSSFKDLPTTYSLPLKIVTREWGEHSAIPAIETVTKSWDNNGRLLSTTDAYGRTEKISYCPAQGDTACPAEAPGWALSAPVESVTKYPSSSVPGSSAIPVVTTHNFYTKLTDVNTRGYTLVPSRKVTQAGKQQIVTTMDFYHDTTDNLNYGLLKKETFSNSLTTATDKFSVIYRYAINAAHTGEITYKTVESEDGTNQSFPSVTNSLFTGQVLEQANASGHNITRYYYDQSNRLTQKDTAVGTSFAASKHFHYTVSPALNQVIITAGNGLQQKIIFDGQGRQIRYFNEEIPVTGKASPGYWTLKKKVFYDSYNHVNKVQTYDTYSNTVQALTTAYEYNDEGMVDRIHLPDGEVSVKQYDSADHCVVSYKQNSKGEFSTVSVILGNVLDKPVKKILLPVPIDSLSDTKTLCRQGDTLPGAKSSVITYDGSGRVASSTDPLGNVVTKHYDGLGHVAELIDPVGDKIESTYNLAGQMTAKWMTPVKDKKKYLLASAKYNAIGQLLWKAGEDGQKTRYTYTPEGKVATITTPTGHFIAFKYNVLGLPTSKWVDGEQRLQTEYDPLTTLPIKSNDITGITTYQYTDDGLLQQLKHVGKSGYPDYFFHWQYDINRRSKNVKNIDGSRLSTTYDSLGRISTVYFIRYDGNKQLLAKSAYDSFSRIAALDYGSGMHREITYDNFGRQYGVADTLSNKLLSEWGYFYDKDDNITSLIHFNNHHQATLHYQYDKLDNLTAMTCSGTPGLSLCPRDTTFNSNDPHDAPVITQQKYTFNALNRIAQVNEVLSNDKQQTLNKVVTYGYGDSNAPLRLQQVSTTWNNKNPLVHHFSYDKSGNMTTDGEGNNLTYNAFNQITNVINPTGKQIGYVYDGEDRKVKEIRPKNDISYLFYIGKKIVSESIINTQQGMHTIDYLGIAKVIDGTIHEYYEKNYKGDVTGVLTKATGGNQYSLSMRNIYSPYGMVWHSAVTTSQPLYQQTLQGFDGERTDPANGWQFLGAGHRTYNPAQRYLLSEDPAGDGYAFGSNNPIMNTDPTGNTAKWLQTAFKVMGYIGTLGVSAAHKKWATILASSVMIGLMVASTVAAFFLAPAAAAVTEPMLDSGAASLEATTLTLLPYENMASDAIEMYLVKPSIQAEGEIMVLAKEPEFFTANTNLFPANVTHVQLFDAGEAFQAYTTRAALFASMVTTAKSISSALSKNPIYQKDVQSSAYIQTASGYNGSPGSLASSARTQELSAMKVRFTDNNEVSAINNIVSSFGNASAELSPAAIFQPQKHSAVQGNDITQVGNENDNDIRASAKTSVTSHYQKSINNGVLTELGLHRYF